MGEVKTLCHGTNKSIFDKEICKDNYVLKPYNNIGRLPNDLGEGVYLYASNDLFNSYSCAIKYAERYKSKGDNHISMLFYEIIFDDEYVLDLDDKENRTLFIKQREKLMDMIIEMSASFNQNKTRGQLDGLLTDLIIDDHDKDIKVVIKETYTKFDSEYDRSNFPNSLEVCVKDINLLKYKNVKHKKIIG